MSFQGLEVTFEGFHEFCATPALFNAHFYTRDGNQGVINDLEEGTLSAITES
jgi:hypothetical protein